MTRRNRFPILFAAALLALPEAGRAASPDQNRELQACATVAELKPDEGLESARAWMQRGGGDPARIARHWKARIHHVHCKDIREAVMWQSNREDWSFLQSVLAGVYTVPGDGLIDYVRVLKELQGYSGWIVVEAEQDPKKAEPATYAKLGHANLSRFVKEAGLG